MNSNVEDYFGLVIVFHKLFIFIIKKLYEALVVIEYISFVEVWKIYGRYYFILSEKRYIKEQNWLFNKNNSKNY
jgi:hypothetical protein